MVAKSIRHALLKPAAAAPQNLSGRHFVVTGAGAGSLGFATAVILANWGATVIATARRPTPELRRQLNAALDGDAANGQISLLPLDLCDPRSVDKFAQEVGKRFAGRLDVLINCAGIHLDLMSRWREPQLSDDGVEIHWRTNYLGTVQLTHRLLPLLLSAAAAGEARIVNVVSMLHSRGTNEQLWHGADPYNSWDAYGLSKLALMHFTFELQRRYAGQNLQACCLHPGSVNTPVAEKGMATSPLVRSTVKLLSPLQSLFMLSPEEGAQTQIMCATAPGLRGGGYYRNCQAATPSPEANDEGVARRLWDDGVAWLNELPTDTNEI